MTARRAVARLDAHTAAALFLVALFVAPQAVAEPSRPVTLTISGGYRIFNHQLGLQDDAAFGVRLGLGITPRAEIALDYVLSDPLRGATGQPASVSALRALARVGVLEGRTRPYAVAGIGGLLVNFNDSSDYSTGTLTAGLGVERSLGGRLLARMEASADFYRAQIIRYDSGGAIVGRSPRTTNGLGTISLAVGTRF